MEATQESTPTKNADKTRRGLKAKPFPGVGFETSRKTAWIVSTNAPKTADELTFTARDAEGRMIWWDVTPPRTNYWHVHEMLGRAYAFEVLDLLNNPSAEKDNEWTVGFTLGAIARWLPDVSGSAASGIADGFFKVIGEYAATGTASR
ncbi:hypothetical protein [Pseudorhodoferax sp.]|uniref:hypothetical protein n=1 Tax=Pseudorhodoferax sp. TaxID=1993553 RepID=UPI002DD68244|nr:hypothetical protein [Pseudorhodoferax sp.]